MRLIDADKLEKILFERREELKGEYGDIGGAVSGALKLVQSQPTVDADKYFLNLGGINNEHSKQVNQVDRKKIEKKLKERYGEVLHSMNFFLNEVETNVDEDDAANAWTIYRVVKERLAGMKEVLDILGIDYSGWEQNIS